MELEYDESAYDALHAFSHEWPCLSLDVMGDDLGEGREAFPARDDDRDGNASDGGDEERAERD